MFPISFRFSADEFMEGGNTLEDTLEMMEYLIDEIDILKSLLKVGKAHLLAQGKLVDKIVKDNLRWVPFTQLANITGLPAMSVPLYWNADNLPLGSQFIAPFAREDRLLQLASQLEQAQPWFHKYSEIKV